MNISFEPYLNYRKLVNIIIKQIIDLLTKYIGKRTKGMSELRH